jgi:hypothetical protein
VRAVFAAVTDIWRLREFPTYLLLKIRAMLGAELTETTLLSTIKAGIAQELFGAGLFMNARVERMSVSTGRDLNPVLPDFSGNSSRVSFQLSSNLRKRSVLGNSNADKAPFLQCEVRMFCHR